jgi:bifunctional non-homologous end joining protein LigD
MLRMDFPQNLRPIRLSRRAKPFSSSEFIFEIKHDGFRALAFIEGGKCDLVSRNGNAFRKFDTLTEWLAKRLNVQSALLDGEVACLDQHGRTVFNDLLFSRGECVFLAFDLLFLEGEDLRTLPLIERKVRLKKLIGRRNRGVLYVDHIETDGCRLFDHACELDL